MKKTLIALAVAASAAVSGSAMAWTANGTGGNVDLGGTLTPVDIVTPWEVKIGDAVTNLDATIVKGQKAVSIVAKNAIPVLGIRTAKKEAFVGEVGISPRINYNGALDTNSFQDSTGTITLDVNDTQGNVIGTLTAPMFAGSEISKVSLDGTSFQKLYPAYASGSDRSFGLGLPKTADQVGNNVGPRAVALFKEATLNFNAQGISAKSGPANSDNFTSADYKHSAYYVSGIETGKAINIDLKDPVAGDATITWKASLPITVSYQ
ncbi:TPA: hypothetical protein ACP7UU_003712 [Escherichia coli]